MRKPLGTHSSQVGTPHFALAALYCGFALPRRIAAVKLRRRPWQFGLASLFWLMSGVAVAIWLDVPYFLHLGSVLGSILVAVAGVSAVGAVIVAPFALFSLAKWLIEDSRWEVLWDKARHAIRLPRRDKSNCKAGELPFNE